MREIEYREAIREAVIEEMDKDKSVFLIGEDIGVYGGAFRAYKGLLEKYGPERVVNTPISEIGIVGAGVGAALTGQRPIVSLGGARICRSGDFSARSDLPGHLSRAAS